MDQVQEAKFKLYQWDSEYLANHSSGNIIAMGRDVEEARANARAELEVHIRDRWGYLFDMADEESMAELASKRSQFEADIAKEPKEARHGAVLIRGSD
jgi:carbamoylphosphate synthase large subunit